MAYLIEHYPTALKVLTFLLALVNLAAWGELDALWAAAEQQCAARPSTRSQAVLQGLLRPMILFTAVLPLFCCSFIQLGTGLPAAPADARRELAAAGAGGIGGNPHLASEIEPRAVKVP